MAEEGLRTKPPKVKSPGLVEALPLKVEVPPALWATVRVGAWASQAAWNLAAVSQPSKVEQHSDHSWPVMPAQPLSVAPQAASVISREPGKGLGGGGGVGGGGGGSGGAGAPQISKPLSPLLNQKSECQVISWPSRTATPAPVGERAPPSPLYRVPSIVMKS